MQLSRDGWSAWRASLALDLTAIHYFLRQKSVLSGWRIASSRVNSPTSSSEYVTKHLKKLAGRITPSALATKQRHLTDFSTWAGADAELSTITRRLTARYVMEVIQPGTQATKAKTDHIANLSAFGGWLERYGFCESNPWRGRARTIKESTRGDASRRMRPYTFDEVQQLLTKLPHGSMRDVTVLALWTGARLEELRQLKVEHVKDGALHIVAGKSSNAVRAIPIAGTIGPLVEHLKSNLIGHLPDRRLPAHRRRQETLRDHVIQVLRLAAPERMEGRSHGHLPQHTAHRRDPPRGCWHPSAPRREAPRPCPRRDVLRAVQRRA